MPSSIIYASFLELALIILTSTLLIQPETLFRRLAPRFQSLARWTGFFFLGLTFCWSVVCGIILSMNNLTLRI